MNDYIDLFGDETEEEKKKKQAQTQGGYVDLFGDGAIDPRQDYSGNASIQPSSGQFSQTGGTVGDMGGLTPRTSAPPEGTLESVAWKNQFKQQALTVREKAMKAEAQKVSINTLTKVAAVLQPFQVFQDLGNSLILGARWGMTGNDRYLKYAQQGLKQAASHFTWGLADRLPGMDDAGKVDVYASKVFEGTSLAKNKGFQLAWDILADPSLLLTLGAGSIKVAANAVQTLSKAERVVAAEKMLDFANRMQKASDVTALAPLKAHAYMANAVGTVGMYGATAVTDLFRVTDGAFSAVKGRTLGGVLGDSSSGLYKQFMKSTIPSDIPIPVLGPVLKATAGGKERIKLYDFLLTPEAKYKLLADDPQELAHALLRDKVYRESFESMDDLRALKIEVGEKMRPLLIAVPANLRPQANQALGAFASSTASTVDEAMLKLGEFFSQVKDPSIRDGVFLDAFKQFAEVRHTLGVKLREVGQPSVINNDAIELVRNARTLDGVLPSFEMLTSRQVRLRDPEARETLRSMQADLKVQTEMVVGLKSAQKAVNPAILKSLRIQKSDNLAPLDTAFMRVMDEIDSTGTQLQKDEFLKVAQNYTAQRQALMQSLEGRGIQTAVDPDILDLLSDARNLGDFNAAFRIMVSKQGMEAPWLARSYVGKAGDPDILEEIKASTAKAIQEDPAAALTSRAVNPELEDVLRQAQGDVDVPAPVAPTPAALSGEVNQGVPVVGDPRDAVVVGETIDPVFKGSYLDLSPAGGKVNPELMQTLRQSGKPEDRAAFTELERMLGSAEYNKLVRERAEIQANPNNLPASEVDLQLRVNEGQLKKVEGFKDWTPNTDILESSPAIQGYLRTKGYNGILGDGGDLRVNDRGLMPRENTQVVGKLPKPKLPEGIDPRETELIHKTVRSEARILTDMDRADLDISLAKNGKDVDELRKAFKKYGLTLPPVDYIKDPVTGITRVQWKNAGQTGLGNNKAATSLEIPVDDPVVQKFLRESDIDKYVADNMDKLTFGERKDYGTYPRGYDPQRDGDVQTYLDSVAAQQKEYDDFFEQNVFSANSSEMADLASRAGTDLTNPSARKALRVFGDDTLDHYIPKTTVGVELAGARFVDRAQQLGLKVSREEVSAYKRQVRSFEKWSKFKNVNPEELVSHLSDFYQVNPTATLMDGVISLAKQFDFGRKDVLGYLHQILKVSEKGFDTKFGAWDQMGLLFRESQKLDTNVRGVNNVEKLRSQGQRLTQLHNQTFKREVDGLGMMQKQVDRMGSVYVRSKAVQEFAEFSRMTGEFVPAERVKELLAAPIENLSKEDQALRLAIQGTRISEKGNTPIAKLTGYRKVTPEMVRMSNGKFKDGDMVSSEVYNDLLVASATDDVVVQAYMLDQFGGGSRFLRAWKAGALGSFKSVFNEFVGNFLNMNLSGYNLIDLVKGQRKLMSLTPEERAALQKGLGGAQLANVERLGSTQFEGMLREVESLYVKGRKQNAVGRFVDGALRWYEVLTGANPHAFAGESAGTAMKLGAEAAGFGQAYIFQLRSRSSDWQRYLLSGAVAAKNPSMNMAEVIEETNRVLFDYRLAPLYARVLSRTGLRPFATFEAFSTQRLVLTMLSSPQNYVRFTRVPASVDRYWMQDEDSRERVTAERYSLRDYEKGSIRVAELDDGTAIYVNPVYVDPMGAPNALMDWSGTTGGIYDMGPLFSYIGAMLNGSGRYGINPFGEILQGQPGGFKEAYSIDPRRALEIGVQTTLNYLNPSGIVGSKKGEQLADSIVHASNLPSDGSVDVALSKFLMGSEFGRASVTFLKYGVSTIINPKLRESSPSPYSLEKPRPSVAGLKSVLPIFETKGLVGDKGQFPPVDQEGKLMPGNYQSRGLQRMLVTQQQLDDRKAKLWAKHAQFKALKSNDPEAVLRDYWETQLQVEKFLGEYLGTIDIVVPSKAFRESQKDRLERIKGP